MTFIPMVWFSVGKKRCIEGQLLCWWCFSLPLSCFIIDPCKPIQYSQYCTSPNTLITLSTTPFVQYLSYTYSPIRYSLQPHSYVASWKLPPIHYILHPIPLQPHALSIVHYSSYTAPPHFTSHNLHKVDLYPVLYLQNTYIHAYIHQL